MDTRSFEVIDGSGFLAIVDPDTYEAFVAEEWTFAQLELHFRTQMAAECMLIWDTSRPDTWEVRVCFSSTGARGLREVVGPIVTTQGRLLLTSFDSLSMAAQFADVTLPESHEADQVLIIPAGKYYCRVVQNCTPGVFVEDTKPQEGADFVIELIQGGESLQPWKGIPWWRREQFVS